MVLDTVKRWTPLLHVAPERFIDTEYDWEDFDLEEWSRDEYTWESDGWYGFKDIAKPAQETIATGRGDCDCYAVVALSDRYAADADGLGIGWLFRFSGDPSPDPDADPVERVVQRLPMGHAIAYDDERVYSSGHITEETPEEFKERTDYDILVRRDLER